MFVRSPVLDARRPSDPTKLSEASADRRLETLLIGSLTKQDRYPGEVPHGHPPAGEPARPKGGKGEDGEDGPRLSAQSIEVFWDRLRFGHEVFGFGRV